MVHQDKYHLVLEQDRQVQGEASSQPNAELLPGLRRYVNIILPRAVTDCI